MIKLTQTVQKGGCAAKVSAESLRKILSKVRFPSIETSLLPQSLLIDGRNFDDASVHRLSNDLAIVSTLDFFTPIVDTPKTFGAIAAANALSDVYAMGGRPLTALGILAFPVATFADEIIEDVMQGACDLLTQARATLTGGHSIDDDTLKFGLAVTGLVHPEHIWSNAGARAGDILILTKSLGTGTLTAALKRGEVTESDIAPALKSMMQLNNVIDRLQIGSVDLSHAVHAATDITGFGLAGHAMQVANASAVDLEFQFSSLPILPGAMAMIHDGFLTKAHRTNREYTEKALRWAEIAITNQQIVFDPQTSGGLLLSVEPTAADAILNTIRVDFPNAVQIGRVSGRAKETSSVVFV